MGLRQQYLAQTTHQNDRTDSSHNLTWFTIAKIFCKSTKKISIMQIYRAFLWFA
jgi:hypothetical protein